VPKPLAALAALFTLSGLLHLVRPMPFVAIVPGPLPAKRALVYVSGLAELSCAGGLAWPPTRRHAGLASAVLLTTVFPANVQMTLDAFARRGTAAQVTTVIRLPLQWPMIRTAWRAWRS
jgi:uncharacterized membrane protein